MGPIQAVKTCFLKYFDFSSRASRSEFWWWTLFVFVGGAVTAILDVMIFGIEKSGAEFVEVGVIDGIFNVATVVPSVAVAVRRLHDANWTGWWILAQLILTIALLPLALADAAGDPNGFSVLLIVCSFAWTVLFLTILVRMFMPGNEGTNRFGPNPLAAVANASTDHRHEAFDRPMRQSGFLARSCRRVRQAWCLAFLTMGVFGFAESGAEEYCEAPVSFMGVGWYFCVDNEAQTYYAVSSEVVHPSLSRNWGVGIGCEYPPWWKVWADVEIAITFMVHDTSLRTGDISLSVMSNEYDAEADIRDADADVSYPLHRTTIVATNSVDDILLSIANSDTIYWRYPGSDRRYSVGIMTLPAVLPYVFESCRTPR